MTTNGLVTGTFMTSDVLVQTNLISPRFIEAAMVSQSGGLGNVAGYLGTVTFRALGGFYDPTASTSIDALQIR